jgi:uncharacterized hydrophobic protein (TIGR00271 family)
MNPTLKKLIYFIQKWLEKKSASVKHHEVIKDIYLEVEITAGYFLILTIANLIALSGLITNTAPVIIGAMLISPLMGPILNIGFAFITGDKFIWVKSTKKITLSVALTLVVAAIATYFSPLKDITNEIISRTRPNLYDLGIAFLAGSAGAVAICTKKNYLTIVPGVAIATAVIPPLSVAGFGIGIGNFNIVAGGFFLFFTNFVAIIISTCIVFYLYGFKPAKMLEADISQLKKRVMILAVVLFIVSIPLIYTLQKSISEVKLRNNIQSTLKKAFDKERQSNLSTFSYVKQKDGKLLINAVVNTVSYMKEPETNAVEKNIKDALNRDVKLYLEQVKVQPGGLKEEVVKPPAPSIAPLKSPSDIMKTSRENVVSVVRQSSEKIEKIISPSTIADFNVGFNDKTFTVSLIMKIKRDTPLSDEEVSWLKRIFTTELNLPIDLKVETVPFVPLLVFKKGETSLSDDMKKALISIQHTYGSDTNVNILVESYTGSTADSKKRLKLAEERINAVITVFTQDYKIPREKIQTVVHKSTRLEAPAVRITVHQPQEKPSIER